jgi:threonine/homoserine/homoserine lactone efflux protein
MEVVAAILGIAAALTLGAMSPGASFLLVARTALAVSRRDGLATAFGMGVGGAFFAAVALFGLVAVLSASAQLQLVLKLLGGVYLVYLGHHIWRSVHRPLVALDASLERRRTRPWRSFLLGLATQTSNPKTAIVYAAVFGSLLPKAVPSSVLVVLPVVCFVVETAWYSVVALALSAPAPRARYLASKAGLDRVVSAIMLLLGIRLIVDALYS